MIKQQPKWGRVLGSSCLLTIHFIKHAIAKVTICLHKAEPSGNSINQGALAQPNHNHEGDNVMQEAY